MANALIAVTVVVGMLGSIALLVYLAFRYGDAMMDWADRVENAESKRRAVRQANRGVEGMTRDELLMHSAKLDHDLWPERSEWDHPLGCPRCPGLRRVS